MRLRALSAGGGDGDRVRPRALRGSSVVVGGPARAKGRGGASACAKCRGE